MDLLQGNKEILVITNFKYIRLKAFKVWALRFAIRYTLDLSMQSGQDRVASFHAVRLFMFQTSLHRFWSVQSPFLLKATPSMSLTLPPVGRARSCPLSVQ